MSREVKVIVILVSVTTGLLLGFLVGAYFFAREFAFSPDLGDPFIRVLGIRLDPPSLFLKWITYFHDLYPREVNKALLFPLLGSLMGSTIPILLSCKCLKQTGATIYGTAQWANESDMNGMGLFAGKGIFLGRHKDGRYLRHDGPEHIAVIAPTRSGKGVSVIVPTLLTYPHSVVVLDIKEENWNLTAGRRAEFSQNIYFNLAHPNSAHFNPLFEVRLGINEVRDAQNLASAIIEPESSEYTSHWIRTATNFFTAALLHILYTASPGKKNLAGLSEFINRPGVPQRKMLKEMISSKHRRNPSSGEMETHPAIAFSAQEVLNKGLEELPSVLSSMSSFLGLFRDPLVQQNTADSHFSILDLVKIDKPRSLYLVFQPPDLIRLRPFIRMMVNLICSRLTEDPAPIGGTPLNRQKVLLLLDEFPALRRLEFFESALGFIAGYGLRTMLIMQSVNQLKNAYGERTSIFDNTHIRVFYTPNTLETADYLSKSLGTETVRYTTHSEGGKKGAAVTGSFNEAEHFGSRSLMYPREVLEMSSDEGIILIGGNRPIKSGKIRYHVPPDSTVFSPLIRPPPSHIEAVKGLTKTVNFESKWLSLPKDSDGINVRHSKSESQVPTLPSFSIFNPSEVQGPEEGEI